MTKEELIPGNWYRLDYYGHIYIFKYRKNGDNIATEGKYISNDKIEEEPSDNFTDDDSCRYMTPANMEDVYKYFPQERQEQELIEGEWYNFKGVYDWIVKFKEFTPDKGMIICHKAATPKDGYIARSNPIQFNYNSIKKVIGKANMDEVYKLFPEEIARATKKEEPMNTYGLNVGDVIKADVLTKWINLPSQNNSWDIKWKNCASVRKDSPIYEFKQIDGITVFRREVGKSADFWIKAEGFKEFADGKVELTSLPEKWCIKTTQTNPEYEALVKWRTAGGFGPNGYLMCEKYKPGTKGYWEKYKPEGYTEITFEQFKKWVLEQKTTPPPTSLPILREGEYYTIINYMEGNPGEVMIGIVTKGNNGDNGSGSLRGNATFLSSGTKHFHIDAVWCYKDSGKRDFRLSTPEEIEWLKECIKADKYVPKPALNTYGLSIGDKLNAEILNAWQNEGKNKYYDGKWEKSQGSHYGDRTIEKIELLDGIVAFKPTGSLSWGRCEGFKKFAEESKLTKMAALFNDFKPGDWIEVLDTQNVRKYNKAAIGHKFKLHEGNFRNHELKSVFTEMPEQKYGVNYLISDIKKVDGGIGYNVHATTIASPYKFKVGDEVIGNEKANCEYHITREGWTGKVTEVKSSCFRAKDNSGSEYGLGYDYFDLLEEAPTPKPAPVMDTVGTMNSGIGFPKFQKGDELVVCDIGEDKNEWGYLKQSKEHTEEICGVAKRPLKVTEICEFQGRYYYSLETGGWICEDCLSYQDFYKIGIDPYIKMHDPQLVQEMVDFSESYKGSVELYSPKKEAIINPAVNTIRSVEVELVKPKKVVLF